MSKKHNTKKEAVCKNCLLYNFQKQHCSVVVLYEGQRMNPPTTPEDQCLFETEFKSINNNGVEETWKPEIQEVKWWVENPQTGEKSDKGIVKIEYPVGFFGKEEE